MKNSHNYERLMSRPSLVREIDAERAARNLLEFVRQPWPIIEPATAFVPGWHLHAIAEHLQAVSEGHIFGGC
jgi:hypothetical protein